MNLAPYYRIYIDNNAQRDISEQVESFIFEDTVGEDNLLRLTIAQDFAATLADDSDIAPGKIVAFQFGYMGGQLSPLHRARITDVIPKYRERISLDIVCLDLGTVIKKSESSKVWEKLTSSQIAQQIAAKHGMQYEGTTTRKVWDSMPQGNKDDFSFLKYLAKRETDGNFQAYVRGTTLYFIKRNTKGNSLLTFSYGEPEGGVVAFMPSIKESDAEPTSTATELTHIDPKTGQVSTIAVNNTTEAKTGTLGTYKTEYTASGDFVRRNYVEVVENPVEAQNVVNSSKKAAILKTIEATLIIEGNPALVPDNVCTVVNVGQRFAGNWYIHKVKHMVDRAGFQSILELNKNGLGTGKDKATDSNKDIGGDGVDDAVRLKVFDANGKFVRYSSENRAATKAK